MTLHPDHQVAALLLLAGLIGAVIWALRCIDTWAKRRHAEVLAAMRRHPAGSARPEFERSHYGRRPAPGLAVWSDEIEAQYAAESTEAEPARLEQRANDVPFDQEKQ